MSTTPKITMIGLYNHDNALFDDMQLPTGIDKELFVNVFLLNYGEFPVIYTNWDIMKFAIGVWSKKWYDSIERIILAMTEEYNPLHNFDRYEEYTDVEGKKGTSTEKRNTSDKRNANETIKENADRSIDTNADGSLNQEVENSVSAYNEDTYQPDNKENTTSNSTNTSNTEEESTRSIKRDSTDNATGEATANGTTSEDRNLKHIGHLYGNIGVTQSTQMLNAELDLRRAQNIIDIVAAMLYKEVCIYVL